YFFFQTYSTPNTCTLSLHDALPISDSPSVRELSSGMAAGSGWSHSREKVQHSSSQFRPERRPGRKEADEYPRCRTTVRSVAGGRDRKSTRLNSSHEWISYAVFCLKK